MFSNRAGASGGQFGTVAFGDAERAAFLRGEGRIPLLSLAELSHFVQMRGLYPSDGVAARVDAPAMHALLRSRTVTEVNARLGQLAELVQQAAVNPDAEQEVRDAIDHSNDPYALDRMAGLFIGRVVLLRRLAANADLAEMTQLNLLRWSNGDRELLRSLAANPALTPTVARELLKHPQRDRFVTQNVARQAAEKATTGRNVGFADLCAELAWGDHAAAAATAIRGVSDPGVLRELSVQMSSLVNSSELAAVAANVHTPQDVLERMASVQLPDLVRPAYVLEARKTLQRRQAMEAAPNYDPV